MCMRTDKDITFILKHINNYTVFAGRLILVSEDDIYDPVVKVIYLELGLSRAASNARIKISKPCPQGDSNPQHSD